MNTIATQEKSIKGVVTHEKLPGIEVYLLDIGPDVARELLELNTKGQRTISKDAVERYAVDMSTLDWLFNGAAILISNSNELLDGQHRLTAIIESGESQVLLIVRGIDPAAMVTIDAGRKRSYADGLRIRGYANHTTVAAIASRVWY